MRPLLASAAAGSLITLVATAILAAPTAHAETWSHNDVTHDVTAVTFTPVSDPKDDVNIATKKARGDRITDIRHLTVKHARDRVTLVLRIRDVTSGNQTGQFVFRGPNRTLASGEVVRVNGRDRIQTASFAADRVQRCREASVQIRPKKDTVTFTMPTSCLGNPAWIRVSALYGTFTGRPATANKIRFDDALRQKFDPYSFGALSPMVRVD